jgi:hypothetical protein
MKMLTVTSAGSTPEVISMASDVTLAGDHLEADLRMTASPDYAHDVLTWWAGNRDVPAEVSNPDGTADVWVWQPVDPGAV